MAEISRTTLDLLPVARRQTPNSKSPVNVPTAGETTGGVLPPALCRRSAKVRSIWSLEFGVWRPARGPLAVVWRIVTRYIPHRRQSTAHVVQSSFVLLHVPSPHSPMQNLNVDLYPCLCLYKPFSASCWKTFHLYC